MNFAALATVDVAIGPDAHDLISRGSHDIKGHIAAFGSTQKSATLQCGCD
jgi:hypothetical protein